MIFPGQLLLTGFALFTTGRPRRVRSVFPEGLAVVVELEPESPAGPAAPDQDSPAENRPAAAGRWCRVLIHAERLEWIPGALAALGCPFVIEGPAKLRDLVRGLAELLVSSASAT